ncbi:hypothetical protein Daus18300_003355 [Diaporthe australafricana]|uniref:Uncharacterized protein n=1 Tax=Diaporthe australafricana TaxID=127596 RepID=A0ABR3XGP1_9PEZI
MNWTEGNLNRHSRARKGKETLLRQKEHFAKVRAGLPDANVKISPPSVPSLALSAQPLSVRRDTLKSASWRKQPRGDTLASSRYFSEANLKLPTPAVFLGEQTEEEALRQKRRKLLLKGDWVGTNVQKPIEMEFMKPRGSPSNPWGAKQGRRHVVAKHKLHPMVVEVIFLGHMSADSDNAASTLAQLGVERPMIPPSQAEENDEQSSEALSDDHITPVADDDSPSRVEFDLSQSSEGSEIHDGCPSKEQAVTVNSSDGVSLIAVSSSPELPPSFAAADDDEPLQVDQPGDIATRMDAPSPQPGVLYSNEKEPASLAEPVAAVQKQPRNDCTQEDDDDMWRKFVFGGSPENLDQALEDARRDTAKNLRPSLPPTSTSCDESPQDFTTSSLGPDSIERRDFAEGLLRLAGDALTTGSPSHVATAGASSAVLSSEPVSGSPETTMRTDQATRGSTSSSANVNKSRLFFPNDLVTSSIRETDISSLTINPQQLESHSESDDCFKFAPPKLFVGKKIGRVNEEQQIALSAPQIRGLTQTRRRQRRTTDGRANIRKLPNYGSDPIEEFEGDSRSDRAEKGSIFGSLETEDGF